MKDCLLFVAAAFFLTVVPAGSRAGTEPARGDEVVARHNIIFSAPASRVPTDKMPDGPLLGNGDVGVVLAGQPEAQEFFIGKNDFWRRNASIEGVGKLTLSIPALRGASYRQEQDMATAQVRGTFTKDATTVRTRSWVDANSNLLLTELQSEGSQPVEVRLLQAVGESGRRVPAGVTDNDQPVTIGCELHGGGRWYFKGSVAAVSIVPRVLSQDEIRGIAGNPPPVAQARVFDGRKEERAIARMDKAVSVSAWIKIDGPREDTSYIICKGGWNEAYSLGLSGGRLRWAINGTFVQAEEPLEIHKWIHVAGTFDGRCMRAYVDGVLKAAMGADTNGGIIDTNPAESCFTRKSDPSYPQRVVSVASRFIGAAPGESDGALSVTLTPGMKVFVVTSVLSDLDSKDCAAVARAMVSELSPADIARRWTDHQQWWSDFWSRSFVEIPDKEIEKHWYAALYVMGSCSRAGKVAPGLWGNWLTTDYPAWNGDYHLNYNFQAPFYIVYSSNHADLSLPFYQALVESEPNGRAMAKRHGWKGIHLTTAIGPWGLSCCPDADLGQRSDAAFAAMNFIWQYQYTQDAEFLRTTAYPYLRGVAEFWENYLKFENGRYVIYNDSIHENSGPDMNPLLSLGLVRTLFKNMISMSKDLGVDADQRAKWQDICDKISAFPLQKSGSKTVFRYSEKGMAWCGSNTLGIHHIFPAGAIGLDSDPKLLEICRNTIDAMGRWDDANGFSSWYPACARVGYDPNIILAKLREQCEKHSMPNLVLNYGGGGIENCSGFLAINEMLLQSHEGVIRLFPDWPKDLDARYGDLRAVGAFLVSAEQKGGVIRNVKLVSEKGCDCTVQNPWPGKKVQVVRNGQPAESAAGARFTLKTRPGETLALIMQP